MTGTLREGTLCYTVSFILYFVAEARETAHIYGDTQIGVGTPFE